MAASNSRPQRILAVRFPMRQPSTGLERGRHTLTGHMYHGDRLEHGRHTLAGHMYHGDRNHGPQTNLSLPLCAEPGNDIRSCEAEETTSLATQLQGASIFQDSASGKVLPSRRGPSKSSPPRRASLPPPPRSVSVGTHSVPRSPSEPTPKVPQELGHRLYVGFLPPLTTKKNLLDRFSVYGEIDDCSVTQPKFGATYTYGFVQFVHKYSSRAAIRALDNTRWGELSILVQPANPCPSKLRSPSSTVQSTSSGTRKDRSADLARTVFVKRLPLTVTMDTLKTLFGRIGYVRNAWMAELQPQAESIYGFVQFHTVEEAGRAVDQLNDTRIGLQRIVVQFAHTISPQSHPGSSTHEAFKHELERVKTCTTRVEGVESVQGGMIYSGRPTPEVAKCTPAQENTVITQEVALGYLKMHIPCPPLTVEPNKGSVVPGQDGTSHEQGHSSPTLLASASVQLDSGIQSQVCSTPTSACSSPVQMVGSGGKDGVESEPPGLLTPTPGHVDMEGDGPMTQLEGIEHHVDRDPLLGVGGSVKQSQKSADVETDSSLQWVTSEEENTVESCPPPLEGGCTEPPPLEIPQSQLSCTAPHSAEEALTPLPPPHDQSPESEGPSPANSRGWVPSPQSSRAVCVPFAMGRGKRLATVLDALPDMGRTQAPVAGLTSTSTPATTGHTVPSVAPDTCVQDQCWSSSDTDLPPPLTTQPEGALTSPVHQGLTAGSASRIRNPTDIGQTRSADGDKLHQPPTEAHVYTESVSASVPLATPPISQGNPSSSHDSPLLGRDSLLLRPPESCQVGSSGDEHEMSKTRHGRASDKLERNIAQHERNTRRWQVETRRLKQRSAAIKEELRREEGEEQEWNLFEEVPDERLREFDQILETKAKLVTEAERLRRRELNHEIVLMKAQQCYKHDELALLEITHELEAKEAHDKLSLAKLESTVLQRTATYMV